MKKTTKKNHESFAYYEIEKSFKNAVPEFKLETNESFDDFKKWSDEKVKKQLIEPVAEVIGNTARIVARLINEHANYICANILPPIPTHIVHKHQLDIDYPHYCYECNNSLYWRSFHIVNTKYNHEYLEKLWKSKHVQFYCCICKKS